jgi:hypothetical protein
MSAWRYCDKCGTAQNFPETPQEDTECSSCMADMWPTITTEEWIKGLLERVTELEKARYATDRVSKDPGSPGRY